MILSRTLCRWVLLCALSTGALAQSEPIQANQNREPSGKLENGTLSLQLEIRTGAWHPEADNGPTLYVQAFGEAGKPATIPGPLMRVPQGTTLHVSIKNTLPKKPAKLYGFNTRPGDPSAAIEIPAGETRDVTFLAGAPGTYFYWARTNELGKRQPIVEDAQLNGAFIVDPPGPVVPDRIFVLNTMFALPDVTHESIEVLSINGKSYPFTEPLEYSQGQTIRWRVINPGCCEHPMHLHGSFYDLLSLGSAEKDTSYAKGERQSVVTENMLSATTMMVEWTPQHAGRWLFHCHLHAHISSEERIPMLLPSADAAPPAHDHDHAGMAGMTDMAGLVLTIDVKPTATDTRASAVPVHKIDLVIEPNAENAKLPAFACSVRDGKKLVAAADRSMGPPIVVTRGEAVEIAVLNHLKEPTTIHWHGIELESYYDGVAGGGLASQVTPAVAPGDSFTARFTPNRAGTFIYHTHASASKQLTDGVYGPLIVLNPGETFDPEHDKFIVVGTRDDDFYAKRLTINGSEDPGPLLFHRDQSYRIRLINIAPELMADLRLGSKAHPENWRAIAKDGADLPQRLVKSQDAALHIVSGETYDFDFQPKVAGEFPLEVDNSINTSKVIEKFVVQ